MKQRRGLLPTLVVTSLVILGATTVVRAQDAEPDKTICFVGIAGADDHFWSIIIKGATEAGEQLGVKVNYVSPPQFNIPSMVQLADDCIAAHVDGIAMSMADVNAQTDVAKRAIEAGIPVVADGSPATKNPDDDPFLFWSGSNDEQGGEAGANRILETHTPTGVVCGINEPGNIPVESRCNGAQKVWDAAGIPSEKLATSNDRTQALQLLKGYLTSHPEVDTYFGGSQPLDGLVAEATGPGPITVDLGGSERELTLATFDLDAPILDGVQNDQILFTIDQQTYLRGWMPVAMLAQYLRHGLRPSGDFLTGPAFIDKSNVDTVIEQADAGYR